MKLPAVSLRHRPVLIASQVASSIKEVWIAREVKMCKSLTILMPWYVPHSSTIVVCFLGMIVCDAELSGANSY